MVSIVAALLMMPVALWRPMDQVHDFTLVVRLPKFELEFVASGGFTAKPLYISQRRAAIGLGLA